MNDGGFIKLYRQITKWEWYENINTFRLFVHILLLANYSDSKFEGRRIKRGQLVTSLHKLSTGTSLSVQQVRTSLDHLISTGELTSKTFNKYRIITVVKYDDYQDSNKQVNKQITSNQQADNKQVTSELTSNQQQYKNNKNIKNEKKERREEGKEERGEPRARFTPPTADQVREYCEERGNGINPEDFVNFYEARGWELGHGTKMKDWKAAVRTWERRETKRPGKIVTENPFLRMLREREEAKEE